MWKSFKKFDCWLDKISLLLLLLLLLLVLRIPNLFEPYWYGDEGIYLTIGNAMRQGAGLYRDIVDHKTPIIYYLAMVPNQLWFRALNIVWSGVTTIFFYLIAKKILKLRLPTYLASLIFVLLTSLPALEGNIPNGELFVMGFVLSGGYLFLNSFFDQFAADPLEKIIKTRQKVGHYFYAGLLFGLAILTKVPAIFDGLAFLSLAWFALFTDFNVEDLMSKSLRKKFINLSRKVGLVAVGMVLPIILSVCYFWLRGLGQSYLDFGLLYNFRYVQNWGLPFEQPILILLFTLPAKLFVAATIILAMTFKIRKVSLRFKFIATWLILSLIASTLSNRPYPHYYLQIVPALSILVGYLSYELIKLKQKGRKAVNWNEMSLSGLLFLLLFLVMSLLRVGFYPTISYYQKFIDYATQKISREEYYRSFDALTTDNYSATKIIKKSDSPYLFIWGTNPILYAQSKRLPTGRFTVSFHVRDFKAEGETLTDFIAKKPMFAVVMKNEQPLPGLEEYLAENYIPNANFTHFTLWKRN